MNSSLQTDINKSIRNISDISLRLCYTMHHEKTIEYVQELVDKISDEANLLTLYLHEAKKEKTNE